MKFCQLTEKEFKDFSVGHEQASFLQSVEMGNLRKEIGWDIDYVGVKKDGRVLAGALITSYIVKWQYRQFDVQDGFLADYTDIATLHFLIQEIKKYLKQKKCLSLTINPNIVYQHRDARGKAIGLPNESIIENLKQEGFTHQGFTEGYGKVNQRWIFVKHLAELDESSLMKSFQPATQHSIKKAVEFGVKIRELSYEELPIFKAITSHTSDRRNFGDRELTYYQDLYKTFGAKGKFMVAEVKLSEYVSALEKNIVELKETLAVIEEHLSRVPKSKKQQGKKREYSSQLSSIEKRLNEARQLEKENEILILCGALFIVTPNEIVYLFSGSYDEYKQLHAPFLLQHHMLTYAIQKGIPRYNFYGISGIFGDKKDEGYGVLHFKQGFGGEVEEMLGHFDLVIHKPMYMLYDFLRKIRSR